MKRRCAERRGLEAWARAGVGAALDPRLARHLPSCSECGARWRDIERTRAAVRALGTDPLDPRRVDEMRFQIMAAARGAPEPTPAPRRRPLWPAPLAAALVLGVVVTVFAWPRPEPVAAPVSVAPAPRTATVTLAPGAAGRTLRPAPHEVYWLRDGIAYFAVEPRGPDESFEVRVGVDGVEVRGTVFDVEARAGHLHAVRVTEGRVVVRIAGAVAATLETGETWTRPVSSVPAAVPRAAAPPAGVPRAQAAPDAVRDAAPSRAQDAEFRRAWQLLNEGRATQAAKAFDALAGEPGVDPGRRADALYWSARAYRAAGDAAVAEARARSLTAESPAAWHAPHAALLIGESLLEQGDAAGARRWLREAARSERVAVRTRAAELLAELEQRDARPPGATTAPR